MVTGSKDGSVVVAQVMACRLPTLQPAERTGERLSARPQRAVLNLGHGVCWSAIFALFIAPDFANDRVRRQLSESKLRAVATLGDVLEGHVVKCVRLRPCAACSAADSSILACGGNSHTVRILDSRQGGSVSCHCLMPASAEHRRVVCACAVLSLRLCNRWKGSSRCGVRAKPGFRPVLVHVRGRRRRCCDTSGFGSRAGRHDAGGRGFGCELRSMEPRRGAYPHLL